jgi:hypothetical protein
MTPAALSRRDLLRRLGVGPAVLPFLGNLPSLAAATAAPKRRLVIVFSPDGVVKRNFWPAAGPLAGRALPRILEPFAPFADRLLTLKGLDNKLLGDGDGHMRGIGCLLTGIELGSLEFGVLVPNKADTWTRMVYAGPNQPVAPIDDPYQMFARLYGEMKDRESMRSVLDEVREDLATVAATMPAEDRRILEDHATLVRGLERDLAAAPVAAPHAVPVLEQGVIEQNDSMPAISRMQIELLVSALAADFARLITLQYTNSVGQPHMRWIGVDEGQHDLSHRPDSDEDAQEKLTKINAWYAGEIAHLARRLAETPEPGGDGSLLDHTTIVWTNELGAGNSHSREDIPWVLVGGGLGFQAGRAVEFPREPHNRLLLALAHAMGHTALERFGNPDLCGAGPLAGLT